MGCTGHNLAAPPPLLKGITVLSTHHEREGGRKASGTAQAWFAQRGHPTDRNESNPGRGAWEAPRARLTSTCLALKTMPCAPSPMRPRMQYWSIARPAPPRPDPLPSNGAASERHGPAARGTGGRCAGFVSAVPQAPAATPHGASFGGSPPRADKAGVRAGSDRNRPLSAPPRRYIT